jgi:hypothetical protein
VGWNDSLPPEASGHSAVAHSTIVGSIVPFESSEDGKRYERSGMAVAPIAWRHEKPLGRKSKRQLAIDVCV